MAVTVFRTRSRPNSANPAPFLTGVLPFAGIKPPSPSFVGATTFPLFPSLLPLHSPPTIPLHRPSPSLPPLPCQCGRELPADLFPTRPKRITPMESSGRGRGSTRSGSRKMHALRLNESLAALDSPPPSSSLAAFQWSSSHKRPLCSHDLHARCLIQHP